jgi:hypothetical protein
MSVISRFIYAALMCCAASVGASPAGAVTVTINGVYTYTGAAPSPTANFSFSFNVDRTPGVCGGTTGGSLLCNVSTGHYVDGSVSTTLGVSAPPSALVFDAAHGGGVQYFESDLPLNRLSFVIGSGQLFSGPLSNPTLVNGVYPISANPPCDQDGCHYVSYAGQGFASGDPINNPFQDPISLQSYDPLVSGTITITDALTATPLPAAFPLFAGGLGVIGLLARRRKRKNAAGLAAA